MALCSHHREHDMKMINEITFTFQGSPSPDALDAANSSSHVAWLNKRGIKSFYRGVVADNLRSGAQILLQVIHSLHKYSALQKYPPLLTFSHFGV